ncbi:MAG: chromate efflux transporter [Deltaproteobacteria bacterium]|nr:MAG: chromate efflux transporter [Deltaproteobacteria bacterium]
MTARETQIPFADAVRAWARVAAYSFGGPAGQIAVMHRIVVDEKKWVGEAQFLHALNYCMLLPGPEAQQLATYLGWLLHGTRGGLVAGGLFILPGFVSILVLSVLYAGYGELLFVAGLFFGLKAAVLAVVVEALLRIGKRVLKNRVMESIAALAFVGIFFFEAPFPLIVGLSAFVGLVGDRLAPELFAVVKGPEAAAGGTREPPSTRPSTTRTATVAATWLGIWLLPLLAVAAVVGPDHVFAQISAFFSKAAMVTFGGAYAVLAYIAQQAVEHYGWLQPGEMLDGLGMAETTPGPLIQVVQFVGFMGAYRHPGELHPMLAGTLGALITTWATFAPCFLWIFTGAPYIEWLRGNRKLTAALSSITASVVGVVLNLAVWFGLHVIFESVRPVDGPLGSRLLQPDVATLDPAALLIAAAAMVAMLRFHIGMLPTLGASALAGVLWVYAAT